MSESKNDLQYASSPYLLQHAENPVNWVEWSPAVLQKAKEENKPILISIGYAACHWCHVMAHESFEDKEVAELMNTHFICIKIDREERPDIDHIYMEAAQMLTGRGGWPLNAFALPDGRPFYAATYFPKANWKKVLANIAKAYEKNYDTLLDTAQKLTDGIQLAENMTPTEDGDINFSVTDYKDLVVSWQKTLDMEQGGFKGAPKFPLSNSWQFLLQYYQLTKDDSLLKPVLITLDKMALGGIYDQIGGGFSRYAVDAQWFAPHFEKMLYDNALLINLYANTYKLSPKSLYKTVIEDSIAFVERELMSSDFGFYASLDADSEGEEGKYYVWTYAELEEILTDEELALAVDYYKVSKKGNCESSQNILHADLSPEGFAQFKGLDYKTLEADLTSLKEKLHRYREKRIAPALDDKIITSWNSLMLSALVKAYTTLQEPHYLHLAKQNAEFLVSARLQSDGTLKRTLSSASTSIDGFLDDYAFVIEGLIDLYQVTFTIDYLNTAKQLVDHCLKDFQDPKTGMFYYTSSTGEQLISQTFEINDNVIPASNSSLAKSLFLIGHFFNKSMYIDTAKQMWKHVESKLYKSGPYYANWQILSGWLSHPFYEVAIMGPDAQTKALELQNKFLNPCIFLGGTDENLELLQGKRPQNSNETKIYVCVNKTCQQPTTNVDEALKQME